MKLSPKPNGCKELASWLGKASRCWLLFRPGLVNVPLTWLAVFNPNWRAHRPGIFVTQDGRHTGHTVNNVSNVRQTAFGQIPSTVWIWPNLCIWSAVSMVWNVVRLCEETTTKHGLCQRWLSCEGYCVYLSWAVLTGFRARQPAFKTTWRTPFLLLVRSFKKQSPCQSSITMSNLRK